VLRRRIYSRIDGGTEEGWNIRTILVEARNRMVSIHKIVPMAHAFPVYSTYVISKVIIPYSSRPFHDALFTKDTVIPVIAQAQD
jgi:hypothetical protein